VRRAAVVAVFALASSCAAPRFAVPAGPFVPFPDGAAVWAAATESCRALDALAAEFGVSGRVGGQRVAGLRVAMAIERDGRLAAEARVGATPVFSLRGSAERATLLLQQERRVAQGRADEILDALVGLPMGPDRLLLVLAGCVSSGPVVVSEAAGDLVRIRTADADIYLAKRGDAWVVRAGAFGRLLADYQRGEDGWPSRVGLNSASSAGLAVSLSLRVDARSSARPSPTVFAPVVPPDAETVTLDWLRRNGPLAPPRGAGQQER
jgi:hypothetical protein